MDVHLIEISADEAYCKVLQEYLQANDNGEGYKISATNAHDGVRVSYKGKKKDFDRPVRLGEVMDRIAFLRENTSGDERIFFGNGGVLDVYSGHFQRQDGDGAPLTEKEVSILVYLHQHKGKCVTRDELLQAVWQYVEGVETHTLETHIYRLRQKIESDPSRPLILVTDGSGYRLGV